MRSVAAAVVAVVVAVVVVCGCGCGGGRDGGAQNKPQPGSEVVEANIVRRNLTVRPSQQVGFVPVAYITEC